MENTNVKVENTIKTMSPIAWAQKHGKAAQLVYGWLRNGKLPENCVYVEPNTQKKYLIEEEMDLWFEDHQAALPARTTGGSQMKKDPLQFLQMMIGWFNEAGHEKIAKDLQAVYDNKSAKPELTVVEPETAPREDAAKVVKDPVKEAKAEKKEDKTIPSSLKDEKPAKTK